MSSSSEKIAFPISEFALVCRGCLTYTSPMKNMYDWGLAEDFFKLTDVVERREEAMSELICAACEETLMVCKNFRLQCLESDLLLRNTAKKKTPEPELDLPIPVSISHMLNEDKLVFFITAPDNQDKIRTTCPYCNGMYQKKSDLQQHLIKNHQKPKDYCVETQFYCSVADCSYNAGSGRQKWFSERKFLNQHYKKVHRSKVFQCRYCSKGFASQPDYRRHMKICNLKFPCEVCNIEYKTREKYLVHLLRKHPDIHKKYKAEKRKSKLVNDAKKIKNEEKFDFCDSPKRTFATQTLSPEDSIKNDVALPSWQSLPGRSDGDEIKRDENSTQTVFEDLLSLKSQTSEDEIYFSETVSLSDIQTQTFPIEFGLSRSNKETLTNETQSPDLSIKETQTCICLYDSPKFNYKLFDSITSSPSSLNLTSTETQTSELKSTVTSDVLLSFNSAETQTCSDELNDF